MLACYTADPGSKPGVAWRGMTKQIDHFLDFVSFHFRILQICSATIDCGKIERIAIAIDTKPKARRDHETLP